MPFPLLQLPRELRDLIYYFTLISSEGSDLKIKAILIHTNRKQPQSKASTKMFSIAIESPAYSPLNLLHTCYQIRSEASLYLYKYNTFCFSTASLLLRYDYDDLAYLSTHPDGRRFLPIANKFRSLRILDSEDGAPHAWRIFTLLDHLRPYH